LLQFMQRRPHRMAAGGVLCAQGHFGGQQGADRVTAGGNALRQILGDIEKLGFAWQGSHGGNYDVDKADAQIRVA